MIISPSDVGKANLLVELLLLRSGVLTFSSSWFSLEQVNSLVEYVTWYYSFVFLFFFLLFGCCIVGLL